jgi:hypothetical protein
MPLAGALSRGGQFSRTHAAAISSGGSIARSGQFGRIFTAAMNMAGSIGRSIHFPRSIAATISASGAAQRGVMQFKRLVDAVISGAGALSVSAANLYNIAVSGALSFVGVVARKQTVLMRAVAATLSASGVAQRGVMQFKRLLDAVVSSTGALSVFAAKLYNIAVSGVLSFGGTVVRKQTVLTRSIAGILNYTGTLNTFQRLKRSFSSTISFAGSAARVAEYWLIGTLTWIRVRAAAGNLTASGALARMVHFRRRVISKHILLEDGLDLLLEAGGKIYLEATKVLSFSSALVRVVGAKSFSLASTLSAGGSLARIVNAGRTIAGAITPAGALSRFYRVGRGLMSILSFNSAVSRTYKAMQAISATLSFSASLTRSVVFARSIAGALTPAGRVIKKFYRNVAGALSFAGALTLAAAAHYFRTIAGALSPSGAAARSLIRYKRAIAGVITSGGTIMAEIGAKIYGVLSADGLLARKIMFKRSDTGSMAPSGSGSITHKVMHKTASGVLLTWGLDRRSAQFDKKGLSRYGFNFDED